MILTNAKNNNKATVYKKEIIFIIERLKPWIVLKCLEKENYIITDSQAKNIAKTIVNQAISLNILDKIICKIKLDK